MGLLAFPCGVAGNAGSGLVLAIRSFCRKPDLAQKNQTAESNLGKVIPS